MSIVNFSCGKEYRRRKDVFEKLRSLDYDKARVSSLEERKQKKLGSSKDGSLTYGEVTFDAVFEILSTVQKEYGLLQSVGKEVFVDLGSGAGRPVAAAAVLYEFKECIGIEILENLHAQAIAFKNEYHNVLFESSSASGLTKNINFYQGSIFDLELVNWVVVGDVLLTNCTCFTDDMLAHISILCQRFMKKTSVVITITNNLDENIFDIVKSQRLRMSWGVAEVHYHRLSARADR